MRRLSHETINSIGVVLSLVIAGAALSMDALRWWEARENAIVNAVMIEDGYQSTVSSDSVNDASPLWNATLRFSVQVSNISSMDTAINAVRFDFNGDGLTSLEGISSNSPGWDYRTGRSFDEAPVQLPAGSSVALDVGTQVQLADDCRFAEIDPKGSKISNPHHQTPHAIRATPAFVSAMHTSQGCHHPRY